MKMNMNNRWTCKKLGNLLLLLAIGCILLLTITGCENDDLTPTGENKKGLEAYDAGEYDRAVSYFERAISLDPNVKEYHNNLGMALIQMKQYTEAITQFSMVITNDPSTTEEKKLVKFAYRGRGMAFLQRQNFEEALQAFNNALAIDVEEDWNIDIYYYKANVLECMGYPTSAIENYTAVLDMNPKNERAMLARANLYREIGEYTSAINDYKAVLENAEGSYEAYIGFYACLIETDRTEEAKELLDDATHITVKTEDDKYRLGQVHFYQGNYDAARVEMEYAVENGFAEGHYFLGEILLSEGEYAEALSHYEAYRNSRVQESPTVCNQMAVCYLALFEYDKAEEMINLGLAYEGSPAYQKLLRNRVSLYEGMTEYQKAYEALQDYIVRYPSDSDATNEYRFLKKLLGIES